jgi:hypothetical protein
MDDNRFPRDNQPQLHNAGKEKKLYKKPAFRHERVFETQALSCGKLVSGINQCSIQVKAS